MNFDPLFGLTGRYLGINFDDEKDPEILPTFFKPYQSKTDFSYRVVAIVTAPILLSGVASFCAFMVAYELLAALVNLFIVNDLSATKASLVEAGNLAFGSIVNAIAAFISPVVELIDFVGASIETVMEDEPDKSPQP